MRVLLTGASGFIGRHLLRALLDDGHTVRCALRDPKRLPDPRAEAVAADFTRDLAPQAWAPRLADVDVVINAVGILREQGSQSFEALHDRAPCALFEAAAAAGVRLVLQVSALGADEEAKSAYHLSKKRADDCLAGLQVASVILQPSVVFGADGASARLFAMLASLPLIGLPAGGVQQVQPVHIDDLCAAVVVLLRRAAEEDTHAWERGRRLAVVGPQAMTLRDYLAQLRQEIGLGKAHFLPVPWSLASFAARVSARLPGALLDSDTLDMLARGNTGDAAPLTRLLGRPPRPVQRFIAAGQRDWFSTRARLDWLLPVLRITLALMWIFTGIVSLGVYPVEDSYALLARTGISGALAPLMLYGAALLDIAIGIGLLVLRNRRWLWFVQLGLIGLYTVIITLRLPEFWLHPYGPILKNLPLLAAIWLMAEMDRRR